jgi:ribonuclease HI
MGEVRIKIYCDGASNSFESAICICLEKTKGNPIYHLETFEDGMPSFKMEFKAMIRALEFAEGSCEIISDCKSLVIQLNSNKEISNISLHSKAKKLMNQKDVKIKWVRRSRNLAGIYLEKRLSEMRWMSGLDRKYIYKGKSRRK